MDFKLTKEQLMVQKLVREFAEKEIKPIAAELDEEERFPAETLTKMHKLGLTSMIIPKEYGGADMDNISYLLAVEEVSKVCVGSSMLICCSNSLTGWPILKYGTEVQKKKYLPELASGKRLAAFALTEPSAGSDAGAQQTTAVLDGDEWVINGSKIFITNGQHADTYIVFAMTDKSKGTKGISAFMVDYPTLGFSFGKKEKKMGVRCSTTSELVFEDVRIPKENILGKVGEGFKIAMSTLDGGRLGVAAQGVGVSEGALNETIKYIQERKQFGKTLAKNQAIQFMVADMATEIEAAKLLMFAGAAQKDEGVSCTLTAAMAKMYGSRVAMHVTERCVQLHGGYGYTREYPLERMMRDAKILEIYEGTTEVQQMVISGMVIK
jgi:butyryl-CoA dehydrogenase